MSRPYSAVLPITNAVLRILVVLNWLSGVAILALLVVMPTRQWIMSALGLPPSPEADQVVLGLTKAISTPEHPIDFGAGFSINGWLAVLLIFVLARVFAKGTRMREDLEGTV